MASENEVDDSSGTNLSDTGSKYVNVFVVELRSYDEALICYIIYDSSF